MSGKRVLIISVAVFAVACVLVVSSGFYFAPRLESDLSEFISEKTGRSVRIDTLRWSIWPILQFEGDGLTVGSVVAADALFVKVESLTVNVGLLGLFSVPRQLESVMLTGLGIRIPPRKEVNVTPPEARPVVFQGNSRPNPLETPLILKRLAVKPGAVELVSRDPSKPSKIIQIRQLVMHDLALDRPSPFEANIRYPHPEGDVLVSGRFGPFDRSEPVRTPISGSYLYEEADLSVFREVHGLLSSSGEFEGDLGENRVSGRAEIPDFMLNRAQNLVPFYVDFLVDRQGSDVYLRKVDCSFLDSKLVTVGEIVKAEGRSGRVISLHVRADESRVEDLLKLSLSGDSPPLVGQISLDTRVTIPPGSGKVMERILASGNFRISEGEFTSPDFQQKLSQISRIGRRDQDLEDEDSRTFSDLEGVFVLEEGVIGFENLKFGIPGMLVDLEGTFSLQSEEMDFEGRVTLEKAVSEMTSGRLSSWLRILDPLLKGQDGGMSVPIRIRGSRSSPSVSLNF